jgi:thiol-disulfide isomerase/thioredoxin
MNSLILPLILACSPTTPTAAPDLSEPPVASPSPEEPTQDRSPQVQGIDIAKVEALLREPSEHVRIVNFWATWCGPCVAELPMLRDLADARDDLEVILVSLDLHSVRAKRVLPFIARYDLTRLTHYQLEDPDPAMAMTRIPGWPSSIPVTYILDRQGRVAHQFDTAVRREELLSTIETLP